MTKNSFIISGVVLAAFIAGAVLGMVFQVQKDAPQINKANETINLLKSKAITSVVVYGQINKIEGRTVVVSFNGDTAAAKMRDNAAVATFGSGNTTPQTASFDQLQAGQTVSISAKIQQDGSLQGESIIVLSGK